MYEKAFQLKRPLRSAEIARRLGLSYKIVPKSKTRSGRVLFIKKGDDRDFIGRKIGRGRLILFLVRRGSSLYKEICKIAVEEL